MPEQRLQSAAGCHLVVVLLPSSWSICGQTQNDQAGTHQGPLAGWLLLLP